MHYYMEPELKIYKKSEVIDLSDYVQSMTVSKSLKEPVGSWSVTLNPTLGRTTNITISSSRMLNEILSNLDLCDIVAGRIDRRSERWSFLGLTSNFYEDNVQVNEQASREVRIHGGFALPKLLAKDNIVNAPELASIPSIQNDPVLAGRAEFFKWTRFNKFEGKGVKPQDTPENYVKFIMNNAVAVNLKILDGKNIRSLFPFPSENILDYKGDPLLNFSFLGGETIFGENLSVFAGPVLNYLYECIDKEFYELFFDTTTGENGLPFNTMTIRSKPFSHKELEGTNFFTGWSYWEDLDTVTLSKSNQMRIGIGKSDYELKNFFRVNYTKVLLAEAMGRFGLNFPILNVNSIKRYGVRSLEIDSTLLVDTRPFIDYHNKLFLTGQPKNIAEIVIGKMNLSSITRRSPSLSVPYQIDIDKKEGLLLGLLSKRNKIKEWYGFPYYESGMITTPYNEEITIGKRINLPEHNYYFPQDGKCYKGIKVYAQEIVHTYQRGTLAETKITVTNGQPDGVVKKYFDHPDNQFSEAPIENDIPSLPLLNYDKKFFESLPTIYKDMFTIRELE